jgi:hypothetical protein
MRGPPVAINDGPRRTSAKRETPFGEFGIKLFQSNAGVRVIQINHGRPRTQNLAPPG